eukprot:SAG22_NODE_8534_length_647_cov_1.408759_2_plen_133_part_01
MYIKQLRIMAAAATTLGKTHDAAKWAALAGLAFASYNRLYFSASEGLYKDIECAPGQTPSSQRGCYIAGGSKPPLPNDDGVLSVQTANALPLFLGLPATPADRKRVGDALAHDVMHGPFPGRTTAGLVGTKYI